MRIKILLLAYITFYATDITDVKLFSLKFSIKNKKSLGFQRSNC